MSITCPKCGLTSHNPNDEEGYCGKCHDWTSGVRSEENVVADMLGELADVASLQLQVEPFDAFTLLACLQLAWRHPGLSERQKQIIEVFGRQIQSAFASKPTLAKVSEDGWNVGKDLKP